MVWAFKREWRRSRSAGAAAEDFGKIGDLEGAGEDEVRMKETGGGVVGGREWRTCCLDFLEVRWEGIVVGGGTESAELITLRSLGDYFIVILGIFSAFLMD